MSQFDLSRFRVPLGSIVIDAGLVISLVHGMGQVTEKLQAVDMRLQAVEATAHSITPQADARLRVIERENAIQDRDLDKFREDMVRRLDAQDQKLDLIYRTISTRHGKD